ncbi:hypothetical protein [Tenacibaculum maritimum]|uniref:hypothetical protein n=1 Tax=Tenacibaculum maritimum TaxID=107401 RepID=UPI0012E49983|nr:hypothetical protein [Tenacibaculum maritimum]CAA0142983.1 conserved hypothetical protein [Tenacibaculum maritimum]CAA0165345.1 conserved hypothetical protein [Tenacibaculum maritimum]CAA0235212.1 conserved hypothetical protein [Tenacibaculum maritimum]CAA0250201.1 conserved hypothetical protein [Tenacibaculum maritimum]CAA0251833.1 conserved hypothetical protein [Tenacibaculum maritimum]
MQYKPVELSENDIDEKMMSILTFAQNEYKRIFGIIEPEEEVVEDEITKKDKKITHKVYDFLFEPKYDSILNIFPKKKSS